MRTVKQLLRPERQRQVPEQFSWVDQALVQRHFIDRCDSRAAALYLFLITVADAQGLSYYGESTLARRLHLSPEGLLAARQQLIDIELIAYQAPLYQVLAIAGTATRAPASIPTQAPEIRSSNGPARLAQILDQMGRRRARL